MNAERIKEKSEYIEGDFDIPESSVTSENPSELQEFSLKRRSEDDPMRLHGEIVESIRREFKRRGASYLSAQIDALSTTAEALLIAAPGTVTVSAQTPGAGKSTLIRSLLTVLAPRFAVPGDPVAKAVGGITVVVETSIEGHELLELTNEGAGSVVATLIESANDSVLRRHGCPGSHAVTYKDCSKRQCPDYQICPYMRSMLRVHETPILILLHANYQRHLSNMTQFMSWFDSEGKEHPRRWLIVDELPNRFESNSVTISSLNEAETEIDESLVSYNYPENKLKRKLLYHWGHDIRNPLRRILCSVQKLDGAIGIVPREMIDEAPIDMTKVAQLYALLAQHNVGFKARQIAGSLLVGGSTYYSIGQTTSLSIPTLKEFDMSEQYATFIFSGTATLAPEITSDPDIQLLPDAMQEDYGRLAVCIQRGDAFSASKTALRNPGNLQAAAYWVRHIVSQESDLHNRFLVVTYKEHAKSLWNLVGDCNEVLVPYIDRAGDAHEMLPYFGGMNGSNRYLEATCVICVGLNRFEPAEYLNRTLALDRSGTVAAAITVAKDSGDKHLLTQMPPVMSLQDITLAQDIVQLVFRSALRMHGETQPIKLWLFQPPNGVVAHLLRYFGSCKIDEVASLPPECSTTKTRSRSYNGNLTHAAKLLHWLTAEWSSPAVTPEEIRKATGLTKEQFKEAKKNPDVKRFFAENTVSRNSGKHTIYERISNNNAA